MQESRIITSKDVYSRVTARIIELLEQGTIPWRKPWSAGIPQNFISKRHYTGINAMLLNSLDFSTNSFLTWNQIQSIGGNVKRGEKGSLVVFQTTVEKEVEENGHSKVKKKSLLRYYFVFNIEQCLNIPEKFLNSNEVKSELTNISCERIIQEMPSCPIIRHRGNEAYYVIAEDCINMPCHTYFPDSIGYYDVLFHEIIHATGAQQRLARPSLYDNPYFGTELYSLEELIAEIGSCYLKSISGIGMGDLINNTAYIQGWLKVLKNDKKFILKAASKAQQAVEYILGVK